MQDKLINIKVKQGKSKGIAEKDQAIEMFLHNAFKSDLDMTIGKGAKSSKYKNKDQFLDFAFGKVVLIPNEGSTEKNESKDDKDKIKLKEWNEIINKLQNKSTFLYLYAESKDDAKVFYDGSKKNEFLKVESSKKMKNEKCACNRDFTLEDLNAIVGDDFDSDYRSSIVETLNLYIKKREKENKKLHLDKCLLKAHFVSQIATETSLLRKKLVEGNTGPYYSIKNIKALWPTKAKQLSDKKLKEMADEVPQKKLMNYVYGDKNGNKVKNDGWNFRGRGLIQLTGRANYRDASKYLKIVFPEDYVDLEENFEKAGELKYAVLSAIAFWEGKKVYEAAAKVYKKSDVPLVRKIINKYDKDNSRTQEYFEEVLKILNVDKHEN